jgi:hypothetical protein
MLQKPVIERLIPKLAQPKIGPTFGSATVSFRSAAECVQKRLGKNRVHHTRFPFVPSVSLPTLDDSP